MSVCEAQLPGCRGQASHGHHRKLRSQGGKKDPTLDVCSNCHTQIHARPALSYACGLLVHGWETTAEVPVHTDRWASFAKGLL